ncbi:MAG: DUF86 domain-containing protein [Steroidobacteraceae bacterium]|nr:DUF86 domain-containing protein [Steroidobacteraceae bacterium]
MTAMHLAKIASIQRSVRRAREEFAEAAGAFATDLTHQDAAVMNVLRACEMSIDLAQSVVRERKLGAATSNRDVFRLLAAATVIPTDLAERLQRMVGFRNVAVHRYRDLDVAIIASVITRDLDDLLTFTERVARIV